MPSISPMATRWYSLRMWLPMIANIIIMYMRSRKATIDKFNGEKPANKSGKS